MTTKGELKKVIEESFGRVRPGVIALEGLWGCGKSHLLNEVLNEWATPDDPFRVIVTYNAWEDDSGEKPIVPALLKLAQELDQIDVDGQKYSLDKFECMSVLIETLGFIPGWGGTVDRIERILGHIKKAVKKRRKSLSENPEFNKIIGWSELYKRFGELTDSDSAQNYKVILVIDDLDRILPTKQIDLLESLYHLSQSARILILVAYDKTQLERSIENMFGTDVSADRYIQKIFNCIIKYRWPIENIDNVYVKNIYESLCDAAGGKSKVLDFYVVWNMLIPSGLTNRDLKQLSLAFKRIVELGRGKITDNPMRLIALLFIAARELRLLPADVLQVETGTPSIKLYNILTQALPNENYGTSQWIVDLVLGHGVIPSEERFLLEAATRTYIFESLDCHIEVQRPELSFEHKNDVRKT